MNESETQHPNGASEHKKSQSKCSFKLNVYNEFLYQFMIYIYYCAVPFPAMFLKKLAGKTEPTKSHVCGQF